MELIRNEIRQKYNSDITPTGKVTIIKSLAVTEVVYQLISMPGPPPKTLKAIQSMLNQFL